MKFEELSKEHQDFLMCCLFNLSTIGVGLIMDKDIQLEINYEGISLLLGFIFLSFNYKGFNDLKKEVF